MIEILVNYIGEDYDNAIIITMIHGDVPVVEIIYNEHSVVENTFTKSDPKYEKFSTYSLPSMELYRYGWSRNRYMTGPAVMCDLKGSWKVVIIGTIGGSEHDINFNNFGPVWVEMLEDYHQMKIDVKRLNSQNQ
jgi:hypothetical protein